MACCFLTDPARKAAEERDKKISDMVRNDFKQKQKVIQMLLLGTGESGKSTIRKQMQIIHINGFSVQERLEKLAYMRRNIRDSIACILAAMEKLGIRCESEETTRLSAWILELMAANTQHNSLPADQDPFQYSDEFFDAVERLWRDQGVQESFRNSSRYQLIDSAKYFLDRTRLFRNSDYTPSEQDILRCRIMTNDISDIQFEIKDGHHSVKFRVFDVGGQKGERKKWIQCFNNVTAILYLCDVSSFDLTLKEHVGSDRPKNRLLESLDTFQEVWLNRYLQDVSILLFINKIDQLEEKIRAGKSLQSLLEFCRSDLQRRSSLAASGEDVDDGADEQTRRPRVATAAPTSKQKKKKVGPIDLSEFVSQFDYDTFEPSEDDKREFLQSFPRLDDASDIEQQQQQQQQQQQPNGNARGESKAKRRKTSELPAVHPHTVKTACYVKNIFLEIAKRKRQSDFKYEYHHHTCCYYYTCAVNTDNVKKVLEGCRAFIIDKHLERFGIL